jgi:hypothetical protein
MTRDRPHRSTTVDNVRDSMVLCRYFGVERRPQVGLEQDFLFLLAGSGAGIAPAPRWMAPLYNRWNG